MSSFAVRVALMSESKTDGCAHTMSNLVRRTFVCPRLARAYRKNRNPEVPQPGTVRSGRQHTVANRRPTLYANSSETTDQVG